MKGTIIRFGYAVWIVFFALSSIVAQTPVQAQTFSCSTVTEIPRLECEALVALYNSTGGPNWVFNFNWLSIAPPSTWQGVTVSGGNVVQLNLVMSQLSGPIPPELGNLTELTRLNLGLNRLSGSIPPELGSLTNLEILGLGSNQLSGSIPPQLGNLTNLVDLDLQNNQLSGEIPSTLVNLTKVGMLFLSSNQLTVPNPYPSDPPTVLEQFLMSIAPGWEDTQIPAAQFTCAMAREIPPDECQALVTLYTTNNGSGWGNRKAWLTSPLLSHWYGVTVTDGHVEGLSLPSNFMAGSIPPELSNLTFLHYLDLSNNQLSGAIPPELGSLTHINYLYLDHNQLSGTIPVALTHLNNLFGLKLSANHLSGSIPPELGSMVNLAYVDLYRNNLTGSIPKELGNLINMWRLDLCWNQLSGSIPPELGNMSGMWYLYLMHNQLSGVIPSELAELTQLQFLSLNNNHLSGLIPPELANLTNMVQMAGYLNYNFLTVPDPYPVSDLDYFLEAHYGGWDKTQGVRALLPTSGGEVTSTDGRVTITVPPGSLTEPVTLELAPLGGPTYSAGGHTYTNTNFSLTALDSDGNPIIPFSFATPGVTMTLSYLDSDLNGTPEENLRLYYWDILSPNWRDVIATCPTSPPYQRDLVNNILTVQVCHLTEFALMGEGYQISGTITDGTSGIVGVTISTGNGAQAITDVSGAFTLPNLLPGDYTLTPFKYGMTFTPPSQQVTISNANRTGINFTAVQPRFSISGTITSGMNGLEGVTVSAGSGIQVVTNLSGAFTLPNLLPGTYTLTPVKSGYSFNPASQVVSISMMDIMGLLFSAGPMLNSATYADPSGQCGGNTPCFRNAQTAIDAVDVGRTATLYPGTYLEALTLNRDVTVSLAGDVTLNGVLSLQAGTFNVNTWTLSLSNNFNKYGGTFNASTGALRLNGSMYQYLTNYQMIGSGSAIVNNLTIDNSFGVILQGSLRVSGALTFAQGNFTMNSATLTLGPSAVIAGPLSPSAMIVTSNGGALVKEFNADQSFTFPIGDYSGYTPVTLTLSGGVYSPSASISVQSWNSKHPSLNASTNYLNRYWRVTSTGISAFSADAIFSYTNMDVVGQESLIYGLQYNGVTWTQLAKVLADSNQITTMITGSADFTGGPEPLPLFGATYADPSEQCGGNTPCFRSAQMAIDSLELGSTATLYPGTYPEAITLNRNVIVTQAGDVTLNGMLNIQAGTFNVNAWTLNLSDSFSRMGGSFDASSGTVRLNGGGMMGQYLTNYEMMGMVPAVFNNLIIDNPSGVNLNGALRVNGALTLTQGNFTLNPATLTLGPAATIAGSPSTGAKIVAWGGGTLIKEFSADQAFTFPIGDYSGYTPVTLALSGDSYAPGASVSLQVWGYKHPSLTANTNYLNRYWHINQSGIGGFSAEVSFTYKEMDVVGQENMIYGLQFSGGLWTQLSKALADSHTITATVTASADFTGGPEVLPLFGATYADPLEVCEGHTPCFTNVQMAVDSVELGHTVTLYPGTYLEALILNREVSVSLAGDVTLSGILTMRAGTFNVNTWTLSLNGSFDHTAGNFDASIGTLRLNGGMGQYLTNYQMMGMGSFLVNNLTIDNYSEVTLYGALRVTGLLTFSQGNLITNYATLTLGPAAAIAGSPSSSAKIVTSYGGMVVKEFNADQTFTFPIGDYSNYTPVTLTLSGGVYAPGASITLQVWNSKHPNLPATTNYLNRYWHITQNGISAFSADLSFTYTDMDVVGQESSIYGLQYDGGTWTSLAAAAADSNLITASVNHFSDFTGGPAIPTGVLVTSLSAVPRDGRVLINWSTSMQLNLIGFNVYRSQQPDGERVKLNDQMITVQAIGSLESIYYAWMDESAIPGQVYTYWLEQVETDGQTHLSAPISVTAGYSAFIPITSTSW